MDFESYVLEICESAKNASKKLMKLSIKEKIKF